MSRRLIPFLLITGLIALALPAPTLAGGWAVITLDELPAQVNAGQPIVVGFTVLQHGKTPLEDLSPTISARHTATGESIIVTAKPEGEIGHYTATLALPRAGTWAWSIQAFIMDQPMPPLSVLTGTTVDVPSPQPPLTLPLVVGFLGLFGTAGALWVLLRKRVRWALALAIAGVIVSGVSFTSAASRPAEPKSLALVPVTPKEIGQSLFLAKGCITCHAHQEIQRDKDRMIFVDTGPNLSNFSADPEYLRRWLMNPASIKPTTEMPALQLSDSEIDALTAFLNAK